MAITQATQLADFSSGIGTEGAILEVDNTNNRIGIGTTNPQALLQVGQIIKMDGPSGIITATTFSGNFTGTVTGDATGLSGTPNITVNNIVAAAATFSGEVTYEDVTNIDSIGIVTARAGIDITGGSLTLPDSIIHSSDTNTKIRFPSTDTVTVETSGVERLRVDSSGDVGLVGIATATGLVVVAGSGVYAGHAGVVTAVTFKGNLTGNVTGNVTGNADTATTATNVTVADESSDTTCFPLFTTAATGDLGPRSGTNLTFNSSSGALTATSFVGDGANLTGVASTENIITGTAATFNNTTELQNVQLVGITTGLSVSGVSTFAGNITAPTFIGALTGAATQVTVADESSDTSCNVLFTTAATGDLAPKSGTNLTFNSSSGALTATSFVGAVTGDVTGNATGLSGTPNISCGTGAFSGNVTLQANLDLQDDDKILIGTGDDLQIYHDGSHSYISDEGTGQLTIMSNGTGIELQKGTTEFMGRFITDGAVELYYDNAKKLETKSDGVDITGELQCDSLDVDGQADITGIVTLHDHLDMQDSDKIMLGTGDDLELFHDGANSYVYNNTGTLFIDQNVDDGDINIRCDNGSGGTTTYIQCDGSSGAVKLHDYGTLKFQTTSGGATISGNLLPEANGTRDLGSTSYRFANLYTSDLDLSNEVKGGNEVDGTWGAYTIQEGEDDLFLLNRRNGKKYKFMLQEVN